MMRSQQVVPRRQLVDLDGIPPLPEPVGPVGRREARQDHDGDPVRDGVPVRELRPEDRERLQNVAHQEGLADVLPEPAVVDGTGVPQDPAAGQPEASVEPAARDDIVVVAWCRWMDDGGNQRHGGTDGRGAGKSVRARQHCATTRNAPSTKNREP